MNLPSNDPFIRAETEKEASVAIQLRFEPGYTPTQKQIDSMYRTVQMTLPSLPMENIVISDPEGQLIPSSQGGNGDAGAMTTFQEQLNIKRQIEADIEMWKNCYVQSWGRTL